MTPEERAVAVVDWIDAHPCGTMEDRRRMATTAVELAIKAAVDEACGALQREVDELREQLDSQQKPRHPATIADLGRLDATF